jgi:hypothetical protein
MKDNIAEMIKMIPIDLVKSDSLLKVSNAKISLDLKFFHKEKTKIRPPEMMLAKSKNNV